MGKNANYTSVVIPGECRVSGAREFIAPAYEQPGVDIRALRQYLGSVPLAKLKLREAGNDSFDLVALTGGISQ